MDTLGVENRRYEERARRGLKFARARILAMASVFLAVDTVYGCCDDTPSILEATPSILEASLHLSVCVL